MKFGNFVEIFLQPHLAVKGITKILLDSCRVFFANTKIEQAKERLFWQDDINVI